jgi:hypothetical protein
MLEKTEHVRLSASLTRLNSASTRSDGVVNVTDWGDSLSEEQRDKVDDTTLPSVSPPSKSRSPGERLSYSSSEASPTQSRSSSPTSDPPSSKTSPSIYAINSCPGDISVPAGRRPSVFGRIVSSISTTSTSHLPSRRPSVDPSDFLAPPEHPEKRFIDTIGIVCPGVCDRTQCASPLAHFVSTFRICQPIEYTTALADHGLTHTDYVRLRSALEAFLESETVDTKTCNSQESLPYVSTSDSSSDHKVVAPKSPSTFLDTTEGLAKSKLQANALNHLLGDITSNLRTRGLPVVICVSSFSLFAPNRISEAHIQILHEPHGPRHQFRSTSPDARSGQRLSFIDPFSFGTAETRSISRSRPKLEGRSVSETTTRTQRFRYRYQTSQNRDRSRPWPQWPNAIPIRKRQLMDENADRYGVDPYFRAWLRAGINSRTQSSTYAKYMIEQEDDSFVNRRLSYTDTSSRASFVWGVLAHGAKAWQEQFPSFVNRAKYEHNRKLECRRTVEHGSRLRILRFGFRHPIFPPHTPEMEELGLSKVAYQAITSNITRIQTSMQFSTKCPVSYMVSTWNKIRRRSTEDALRKVSEYIRELNASQRRVVWTIEKIPGVYDRGLARDRTEWEISAWNSEDPLELLIELERWGIIEKRLGIDDDD